MLITKHFSVVVELPVFISIFYVAYLTLDVTVQS